MKKRISGKRLRMKEIKNLTRDRLATPVDERWEYSLKEHWRYWPVEGMLLSPGGIMHRIRETVGEVLPELIATSPRCQRSLGIMEERRKRAIDKWRRSRFSEAYSNYLLSPAWVKFRTVILEERGRKCQKCDSPERLEVHHLTYERLGCEKRADVMVLCKPCHQEIHASLKE